MHTYIRLLCKSLSGFRALMTSARARLIALAASQALRHSRLWARRSDLVLSSLLFPGIVRKDTYIVYCHTLIWSVILWAA
jgi:hypothetical protein